MKKLIVRVYQRGNARKYKSCRLDTTTHENLQKLSELWDMSILQIIEKLTNEALAKVANDDQKSSKETRF
ncbi:hypothetical protein [Haliscomenobacter hydrossis]|uniref:Uncharacterized protein n=1 Tax=Haliscomenobacter hydrossis (strain ATCC 27775 / DSM 1100 / LMG 10767 / O) TaxID=760192 RepID=F4L3V2_HALH1|nr:hypothetical protein [Haliscomenobacter hydrossis]AEE48706.1 hypothetical protein Halhy_0799 [Haliscomenobacter hydrossis DSM 1100]